VRLPYVREEFAVSAVIPINKNGDNLIQLVGRLNERYQQLAHAAEAAHRDYIMLRDGLYAGTPQPAPAGKPASTASLTRIEAYQRP